MSTYIDILRAHQQGKLKVADPSRPEPAAPSSETPPADPVATKPDDTQNESPEAMLREEQDALVADADDAENESPETMLREEPDALVVDADDAESESPEAMLREEGGAPLPDIGKADSAELGSLLQEEAAGLTQDFSEEDDALFAQMLQEEPESLPEAAESNESEGMLADEVPQVQAQSDAELTAEDAIHTWLSGCVMLLVRLYEDAAHDTPTDTAPLLRHLHQFSATIYEDAEELSALELDIANRIESIRQSHADCGDLVQKAVMMMLYGFKVCVQMRMEPAEIDRHVAAAILHNIGMAQILVETRQKEGKLTNAERTLIRHVPERSVDYLKRCGISDRIILLAAQQAQERHDGSGPTGLTGADISLGARIVGLLSMFEALVHVRSYRERLLPRDAIRELVNGQKNRFDPAILKNLIESVSLYPVGTYVQLNSGDIGQVVRVQPRLPLRPKIMLTMDRLGNRIQPREVDLQKQPNLMVQRCMYREGLAPVKAAGEENAGAD